MTKASEIRSQARRAALVKRAGVLDRLAMIGSRYKELLTGKSPLMSLYTGGKQFIDAVTGGEAGVSPAAEKLKYMWSVLKGNSPVSSELRKVYATRAGTGIAGIAGLKALLGGSGEKKAAEANQASLCKDAQVKQRIAGLLRRAGQLLAGGDKAKLAPHLAGRGSGVLENTANYFRTLSGTQGRQYARRAKSLLSNGASAEFGGHGITYDDLVALGDRERAATGELRKVLAARAGAGIAGIAGLKALFGGSGEKKAAEAASPEERAFAAGFCKAAEEMGVDPETLYKQALPQWVGKIGGGFKRFGQLLAGGNARELTRHTMPFRNRPDMTFGERMNNYWRNLLGMNGRAAETGIANRVAAGDMAGARSLRGRLGWERRATNELRKSLAARVGTGAAALGAGSMVFGGGDEQA